MTVLVAPSITVRFCTAGLTSLQVHFVLLCPRLTQTNIALFCKYVLQDESILLLLLPVVQGEVCLSSIPFYSGTSLQRLVLLRRVWFH